MKGLTQIACLTTSHGTWNPVKELKEDSFEMLYLQIDLAWNPVKELKVIGGMLWHKSKFMWNPVKELKDLTVARNDEPLGVCGIR